MAASASFKRKSSSSGASGIGRAATRLATGSTGRATGGGGKAKTASVQHQFEEAPAPVAGGPMTPEQPLVSAPAPAAGGTPAPISGGATVPGSPAGGTAATGGGNWYDGPAPDGGAWAQYQAPAGYVGPGQFNPGAPVQDPNNPARSTTGLDWGLAQATYTPQRPPAPGFGSDGRPYAAIALDEAAKRANPYATTYPDSGYFDGQNWHKITDYGTPVYQPPAPTPQQQHYNQLAQWSQHLSPDERMKQAMIALWGPQGRGW